MKFYREHPEILKEKAEVIRSIKDSQIKKPHHIPVGIYIREAGNLYKLTLDDKETLMAAGLAPELIENQIPGNLWCNCIS